uniref:FK506-binding protein 5-like isoform X2 n=1 Tax=Ciona intestinalis TaxID=7719 RepID=UPI000EF44981|nr:FK506-binding protein 5-like isoform X2 [Ciona intestinalis]|eukprot:XP_026689981.1 FK506-binding protein 5-like isoform X2 [Ciona intestinalis]
MSDEEKQDTLSVTDRARKYSRRVKVVSRAPQQNEELPAGVRVKASQRQSRVRASEKRQVPTEAEGRPQLNQGGIPPTAAKRSVRVRKSVRKSVRVAPDPAQRKKFLDLGNEDENTSANRLQVSAGTARAAPRESVRLIKTSLSTRRRAFLSAQNPDQNTESKTPTAPKKQSRRIRVKSIKRPAATEEEQSKTGKSQTDDKDRGTPGPLNTDTQGVKNVNENAGSEPISPFAKRKSRRSRIVKVAKGETEGEDGKESIRKSVRVVRRSVRLPPPKKEDSGEQDAVRQQGDSTKEGERLLGDGKVHLGSAYTERPRKIRMSRFAKFDVGPGARKKIPDEQAKQKDTLVAGDEQADADGALKLPGRPAKLRMSRMGMFEGKKVRSVRRVVRPSTRHEINLNARIQEFQNQAKGGTSETTLAPPGYREKYLDTFRKMGEGEDGVKDDADQPKPARKVSRRIVVRKSCRNAPSVASRAKQLKDAEQKLKAEAEEAKRKRLDEAAVAITRKPLQLPDRTFSDSDDDSPETSSDERNDETSMEPASDGAKKGADKEEEKEEDSTKNIIMETDIVKEQVKEAEIVEHNEVENDMETEITKCEETEDNSLSRAYSKSDILDFDESPEADDDTQAETDEGQATEVIKDTESNNRDTEPENTEICTTENEKKVELEEECEQAPELAFTPEEHKTENKTQSGTCEVENIMIDDTQLDKVNDNALAVESVSPPIDLQTDNEDSYYKDISEECQEKEDKEDSEQTAQQQIGIEQPKLNESRETKEESSLETKEEASEEKSQQELTLDIPLTYQALDTSENQENALSVEEEDKQDDGSATTEKPKLLFEKIEKPEQELMAGTFVVKSSGNGNDEAEDSDSSGEDTVINEKWRLKKREQYIEKYREMATYKSPEEEVKELLGTSEETLDTAAEIERTKKLIGEIKAEIKKCEEGVKEKEGTSPGVSKEATNISIETKKIDEVTKVPPVKPLRKQQKENAGLKQNVDSSVEEQQTSKPDIETAKKVENEQTKDKVKEVKQEIKVKKEENQPEIKVEAVTETQTQVESQLEDKEEETTEEQAEEETTEEQAEEENEEEEYQEQEQEEDSDEEEVEYISEEYSDAEYSGEDEDVEYEEVIEYLTDDEEEGEEGDEDVEYVYVDEDGNEISVDPNDGEIEYDEDGNQIIYVTDSEEEEVEYEYVTDSDEVGSDEEVIYMDEDGNYIDADGNPVDYVPGSEDEIIEEDEE